MYTGKADWDIIKAVKQRLDVPVIGNGDIFVAEDARAMIDYTGCDGVMIARGAQGNPWIFAQCAELLEMGQIKTVPTLEERFAMALRHTKMLIQFKGEYIGIREARSHLACYLKGIRGASKAKDEINHAEDISEIEAVLKKLINMEF
jgi:tRNA-dihydrouridine synthase B